MPARTRLGLLWMALALTATLIVLPRASAQEQEQPLPSPPAAAIPPKPVLGAMPVSLLVPLPDEDGAPDYYIADTNASFIDPASPWNILRLRIDDASDMNRPTRAEYFMTGSGKKDRGLGVPERRIDFQEVSLYGEYAILPQLSVFMDSPYRFIEPAINKNHDGPGDTRAGLKLLGLQTYEFTSSFQCEVFIPTASSTRGIGPGHPSLQGGILTNWQPWRQLILEGMFNVWVPINDSKYGGEMLIYGVSASYGAHRPDDFWIAPVLELTGWTAIRGEEQVVYSAKSSFVRRAGGDTIINGNLGVRAGFGCLGDVYLGYSRALSGDVWWKNMWRVEVRYRY